MSVVKINAITVPEGRGAELEGALRPPGRRSGERAGLRGLRACLRPVEGETRYFVYTRWESEEAFQNWFNSQDFQRGHAQANSEARAPAPVGTAADLLSFEVVTSAGPKGS